MSFDQLGTIAAKAQPLFIDGIRHAATAAGLKHRRGQYFIDLLFRYPKVAAAPFARTIRSCLHLRHRELSSSTVTDIGGKIA